MAHIGNIKTLKHLYLDFLNNQLENEDSEYIQKALREIKDKLEYFYLYLGGNLIKFSGVNIILEELYSAKNL